MTEHRKRGKKGYGCSAHDIVCFARSAYRAEGCFPSSASDYSSKSGVMDEKAFQRYSHYYDLLYRDKDYQAEVEYVARTLRSVAPDGAPPAGIRLGNGSPWPTPRGA